MPEPMVLKPEDKPYRHLQTIHGCLRDARIRLAKLVCTVRVGIVGNPRDGYFVKRRVLTVVNDKVRRVAGDNLGLYDRLKDKVEGQTGVLIKMTHDEGDDFGLPLVTGPRIRDWRQDVKFKTALARGE